MNIEQDFGARVKYLRTRKGWTQDDLAKRLGYTNRATVSKIESSTAAHSTGNQRNA